VGVRKSNTKAFLNEIFIYIRTFKMEKDDGTFIEVRIPPFNLECKSNSTAGGKPSL
jgi:hypothetical protein